AHDAAVHRRAVRRAKADRGADLIVRVGVLRVLREAVAREGERAIDRRLERGDRVGRRRRPRAARLAGGSAEVIVDGHVAAVEGDAELQRGRQAPIGGGVLRIGGDRLAERVGGRVAIEVEDLIGGLRAQRARLVVGRGRRGDEQDRDGQECGPPSHGKDLMWVAPACAFCIQSATTTKEIPLDHATRGTATTEHAGAHAHDHAHELGFWRKYVFSVDHKVIGIQYAVTGLLFLLFGFTLMMLMRWNMAYPGRPIPFIGNWFGPDKAPGGIMLPEFYNQLGAMHGTIMVFLGVVPLAVGGFGNFVMPLQIGAPDMAFPKLNMMSYWVYFCGGVTMLASFFQKGGAG